MIDVEKYPILSKHKSTLKETSKDSHDGNDVFMTESLAEAINFDDVKSEYICNLKLSDSPKSNDALFINSDSLATFIEFKNGFMDNQKIYGVRKKIYDSMLMLSDIVGKNISYTRNHLDYILVYNNAKNPNPKKVYRESEARDSIDKAILSYADQRQIKFGIEIFQGYCFRNVYTYTEKEFKEKFVDMLWIIDCLSYCLKHCNVSIWYSRFILVV